MTTIELTQDQKDLFRYIDSIIPEDGNLTYDLRDEQQYRFAVMTHELSGKSRDNYPGLYQLLDDIRQRQIETGMVRVEEADDKDRVGWKTDIAIADVGSVGSSPGTAGANGMGTVVAGFTQMTLAMYVQDNLSQNIVAEGNAQAYNPAAFLPVTTDNSTASAPTSSMTAYISYTYVPRDNRVLDKRQSQAGVSRRDAPDGVTQGPIVDQPVHYVTNSKFHDVISIGLGRNWGDQGDEFDYVWNEEVTNHPKGRIPFVGNVTFPQPIQQLTPGQNFNVFIKVTDTTGGGALVVTEEEMNSTVYPAFNIDPNNPNNLIWNLPSGESDLNTGNPIVFPDITWPTETLSNFYCSIQVLLQDGTLGFATVLSGSGDDVNGTTYILPIEFVWHCLGKGTRILCADKTERNIEDFKRGHEIIKDGVGTKGTVDSTNLGSHKGPVLRLATDKGHELIISHNHPVMTSPGDGKRAHELAIGDEVLTLEGTAGITELEELPDYRELMGNLAIDGHLEDQIGTFFANGILVGDVTAQRKLTRQRAQDMEWVKKAVGEYWHRDVESYFAGK